MEDRVNELVNNYYKLAAECLESVKLWERKIQITTDKPEYQFSRRSWLRSKDIALTRYECYRAFIFALEDLLKGNEDGSKG